MILSELIHRETGVSLKQIMLLRHSNQEVAKARHFNVSIDEYTAMQPIGTKYDFFWPDSAQITVVAVVVDDYVYAIYRIAGVIAEGMVYAICSDAYRQFESARQKDDRVCRLFKLHALPSISIGLAVRGWEGSRSRTPVQRFDSGFFREIEVGPAGDAAFREAVERAFQTQVEKSSQEPSEARLERLRNASATPSRVATTTFVYTRNPDVVAETLVRANGACQTCGNAAPFARRSDGTPYLEVHHRLPLADGGADTLENAIALCPNCHRQAHYG